MGEILDLEQNQKLIVGFKNHLRAQTHKQVEVNNLAEAKKFWEEYRDDRDLGSSNSPCVIVYDINKRPVATISYNGRVWEPGAEFGADYCTWS
jgi:hypothetical protein